MKLDKTIESYRDSIERKMFTKSDSVRWRPSRLLVNNYWIWDIEEFYFVNGRLFLNGSNASGKSNALAAAITLCLDGEKERRRLDPFGSSDRRIQDYIIGPSDAKPGTPLYHKERTSYIAIEFMDGNNNYLTIGIGLHCDRGVQAHPVKFWGFILNDGRRIGVDFHLCGKDRIPYNADKIKAEIGDQDKFARKVDDYKKMVNRELLGFSIEQYEKLMQLLLNLRSSQLSNQFRPSTVTNALRYSLPPIDEATVKSIHQILDSIDDLYDILKQREQQQQIASEWLLTESTLGRYKLQLEAYKLLQDMERITQTNAVLDRNEKELQEQEQEYEKLTTENSILGTKSETGKNRLLILKQHTVIKEENKKKELTDNLTEAQNKLQQFRNSERTWASKVRGFDNKIKNLESEWDGRKDNFDGLILELHLLVESWHWPALTECLEKLNSTVSDISDKTTIDWEQVRDLLNVLIKENTDSHNKLSNAKSQYSMWSIAEKTYNEEFKRAQTLRENLRQADNNLSITEKSWEASYASFVAYLESWLCRGQTNLDYENRSVVPNSIQTELLQGIPDKPEHVAIPLDKLVLPAKPWFEKALNSIQKAVLEQTSRVKQIESKMGELEKDLDALRSKREAEPDYRKDRDKAKDVLNKYGIPNIPLYALCKPRTEVDKSYVAVIEAMLEEMGLLDALVIPQEYHSLTGEILQQDNLSDAWINPTPGMGNSTLYDYLEPDINDESYQWTDEIVRVLKSVCMGDSGLASIDLNRGWQHGILAGTINPREDILFLGFEARKRNREAQIKNLELMIEQEMELYVKEQDQLDNILLSQQALNEWWDDRFNAPFEKFGKTAREVIFARERIDHTRELLSASDSRLNQLNSEKMSQWEAFNLLFKQTVASKRESCSETIEEAIEALIENQGDIRQLEQTLINLERLQDKLLEASDQLEDAEVHWEDAREEVIDWEKKERGLNEQLQELEKLLKSSGYDDVMSQIQQADEAVKRYEKWLQSNEYKRMNVLEDSLPKLQSKLQTDKQNHKTFLDITTSSGGEFWQQVKQFPYKNDFLKGLPSDSFSFDNLGLLCKELLKSRAKAQNIEKNIQEDISNYRSDLETMYKDNKHLFIDYAAELNKDKHSMIFRLGGPVISLPVFLDWLESEIIKQRKVIEDKDRDLFEKYIINTVSDNVKSCIIEAQEWVEQINRQLIQHRFADNEYFELKWREIQKMEKISRLSTVAQILLQPSITSEKQNEIVSLFKQEIDHLRELDRTGQLQKSFYDELYSLLDYRNWYEFAIFSNRKEYGREEIRDEGFGRRSGAQRALSMYVPMLAACISIYEQGKSNAPRLIGLDEAFAGVDAKNIDQVFKFMVKSDFSWIITSEKLTGELEVLPGSMTYVMRAVDDIAAADWYMWNGRQRMDVEKPIGYMEQNELNFND